MFEKNKWILGLFVGTMTLSGIAILDYVVVKVIFAASGAIAYAIVGSLLSTGFIMSKADAGQARMEFFVILLVLFLAIYIAIIKFVTWLISFPLWVYIIIFVISGGVLGLRVLLNKRAGKAYEKESKKERNIDEIIDKIQHQEQKGNHMEFPSPVPKTIYELLTENKDKKTICVERIDNESPGLQYVRVNQDALRYPILKGYLKFDNAGVFREIYYANESIWRLYNNCK